MPSDVSRVQKFSENEDQITIEMKVPSPLGEEGETQSNDWIAPTGTAKVGDIVKIAIKEP